jgi:hypothetical protein
MHPTHLTKCLCSTNLIYLWVEASIPSHDNSPIPSPKAPFQKQKKGQKKKTKQEQNKNKTRTKQESQNQSTPINTNQHQSPFIDINQQSCRDNQKASNCTSKNKKKNKIRRKKKKEKSKRKKCLQPYQTSVHFNHLLQPILRSSIYFNHLLQSFTSNKHPLQLSLQYTIHIKQLSPQ